MNTKRTLQYAALLLATISLIGLLPGCGGGSGSGSGVAGTYELDKEAMKAQMKADLESKMASGDDDDGMAAFASTMMLGMIESMEFSMTLHDDGTATMHMNAMGDSQDGTGTWTRNGDELTITIANEGEEPKPGRAIIDGDTLRLQPDEGDDSPMEMIFRKKKD